MVDRILAERLAVEEERGAAREDAARPSPMGRTSGSPPPDLSVPWAPGHGPSQ